MSASFLTNATAEMHWNRGNKILSVAIPIETDDVVVVKIMEDDFSLYIQVHICRMRTAKECIFSIDQSSPVIFIICCRIVNLRNCSFCSVSVFNSFLVQTCVFVFNSFLVQTSTNLDGYYNRAYLVKTYYTLRVTTSWPSWSQPPDLYNYIMVN